MIHVIDQCALSNEHGSWIMDHVTFARFEQSVVTSHRQAITISIDGVDVPGIIRIRLDLPSESSDEIVDAASERDVLVAPDVSEEFIAAYNFTYAGAHVSQDFDFALAESDLLFIPLSGVAVEVDAQRTQNKII